MGTEKRLLLAIVAGASMVLASVLPVWAAGAGDGRLLSVGTGSCAVAVPGQTSLSVSGVTWTLAWPSDREVWWWADTEVDPNAVVSDVETYGETYRYIGPDNGFVGATGNDVVVSVRLCFTAPAPETTAPHESTTVPRLPCPIDGAVNELTIDGARGAPGSVHVFSFSVPEQLRGRRAVALAQNNGSVHPGTKLVVSSGNTSVVLDDVEGTPFQVTVSEAVVLGEEVTVSVTLGPDGIFSGGMLLKLCVGAATTTTAALTTTTATATTTTLPPTTTTTTTTTTVPVPSTTLPRPEGDAIDPSKIVLEIGVGSLLLASFGAGIAAASTGALLVVSVRDRRKLRRYRGQL